MQDEQQYQQLMMQYTQLKNGAIDIAKMIEEDNFDTAITMIKARGDLMLSCKCIRRYLELTPVQQKEVDSIVNELRDLELSNINTLKKKMEEVQIELSVANKTQKLQKAYDNMLSEFSGSTINVEK